MLIRPEYIIIHHSLTQDGPTVSWNAIRQYHVRTLGWRDIGYHFGIELIGDYYEVLLGRLLGTDGAHCKEAGMNSRSIGICCVGNYDIEEPPEKLWRTCTNMVREMMREFVIPASHVRGHGEVCKYKTCPGKLWDMERFRRELA